MPIPAFNIDDVLPPFTGSSPALSPLDMSPYTATVAEVVNRYATSPERRLILAGWLEHRVAVRSIGITHGFQWLDGSFVENKESRPPDLSPGHPGDIDVMMFMRRPANFRNKADFQKLLAANRALFDRRSVKSRYHVDIFTVDMGRATDYVLRWARYYLMLFSHRRLDQVWKGLLEVRQEDDGDDAPLLARLQSGEWP